MNVYVSKEAKIKVTYKKYFLKKCIILKNGIRYYMKKHKDAMIIIVIDHILYNESIDTCEILTTCYYGDIYTVSYNFSTVTEFLALIGMQSGTYTIEIIKENMLYMGNMVFKGLNDMSMYTENKDIVSYKIKNSDEIIIKEGFGLIKGIRKEQDGTMSCVISDIQYDFNKNGILTEYDYIENCTISIAAVKRLVH